MCSHRLIMGYHPMWVRRSSTKHICLHEHDKAKSKQSLEIQLQGCACLREVSLLAVVRKHNMVQQPNGAAAKAAPSGMTSATPTACSLLNIADALG